MDITIVGGNSQVGTELAFMFREDGHDVTPVVRNQLGASFLLDHGFDCYIGTIGDSNDARRSLAGTDLVTIAAYAPPFTGGIDNPRQARTVNDSIVENAFNYAPATATVVYFSTVSAYGTELYREGEQWRLYAREKRHLEDKVESLAGETGPHGYAFRLGHVLGTNQNRTHQLQSAIPETGTFVVRADPTIASNTVHTVTIRECIERCATDSVPQGRYTVVNEPQWTWGDVIEFYTPDSVDVEYRIPSYGERQSLPSKLISESWNTIIEYKNHLIPYMVYIPERINRRLMHRSRKEEVGSDIGALQDRNAFHMEEFDLKPIAGRSVSGVSTTEELLDTKPRFNSEFALRNDHDT